MGPGLAENNEALCGTMFVISYVHTRPCMFSPPWAFPVSSLRIPPSFVARHRSPVVHTTVVSQAFPMHQLTFVPELLAWCKHSARHIGPQVLLLESSGFHDPALPSSVALAAGAGADYAMLAACSYTNLDSSMNLDSAFVLEFPEISDWSSVGR